MTRRRPKVLCLDDQRDHLRLRKDFLELFGCEVTTAEDARSCLDAVARDEFDLAILDYHLGVGLTGEDVARELHDSHPSMPLIMLTGDPMVPKTARDSVDAVLIKGASNPRDLLDLIETLTPGCTLKPRHKPMNRETPPNFERRKISG
jgi:CheY-like chemotaxis protein